MLIDVHQASRGTVALVGIGINVNGDPGTQPDLANVATSLAVVAGRSIVRESLLAGVMNTLEPLLGIDVESVLDRYRAKSNTLGQEVLVQPAVGGAFEGVAVRLAGSGALVVRRVDGTEVEVEAADVSVRPRA
jgi:biotin-(acetyl-CoA carboxylase) ligase